MVDLAHLRHDLASLPGLTAADAERMVRQLQRAVREADRAAARAAAQGQTEAAR